MLLMLAGLSLSALAHSASAADAPLTPKSLESALQKDSKGAAAEKLAANIRTLYGADALKKGPNVKVEGLTTAWAIEAPGAKSVKIIIDDGRPNQADQDLIRVGKTDVYAIAYTLPEGTGFRWTYDVDGKRFGGGNLEVHTYHPDCAEQPGVPKGKLTQMPTWKSKIFDGTERDWWVYVPAQYTPDKPACVMVFQDGGGYKNYTPTIFDNLIAKGEMPVTVGIFIQPGHFPDQHIADGRQRSIEYDTLSDTYARFLLEEILPEVEKTTKLRHDAASRAIGGLSSGAICAWTVAWERPNEFSKVLSWIGSFTGIASGATLKEGGNNYPVMIRKTNPHKPIRIYIQDGDNDLDNDNGNWPLANQEMVAALKYKKYEVEYVFGHGFHSEQHGHSIMPVSLKWLWEGYKP